MKAAVYRRFGPPEVLEVREVETPRPKENELLIRIHATTVEKEDPGMRKSPGLNGILRPRHSILGMELAGVVEETGAAVTRFVPGDEVYGNTGMSLGGYAEYICLPEDGALARKPRNLSFAEAAACTNGALTAIPFLRDLAGIRYGNSVLINGASGTVGSAAVQIAAYLGASVTGVCSTGNLASVQALGAGELIDYNRESFVEASLAGGKRYDVVFDVAGTSSFGRCAPILQPEGTYLATIPGPAVLLRMLTSRLFGRRRALFAATGLRAPAKKAAYLEYLREIAEAGRFRPRIDRSFTLEQIAEAHRHVESGRKNGTVVITVDPATS